MINLTNRHFAKLSADQKQFLEEGTISASMSARKWIRFLEPICQHDERRDSARTPLILLLVALGIGLIFLGYSILSDIESSFNDLFLSPLFLLGIAAFIGTSILLYKSYEGDINNNIREFIYPLMSLMSLEIGNRKKIKMDINFNKPLLAKEITKNIDHDSGGFFSSGRRHLNSKFYEYPVLKLSCNLIDGTRVQWNVLDSIRERAQRSSRGRRKIKHKLKRKMLLSMSFPKSVYSIDSSTLAENKRFRESDEKITYRRILKEKHTGKFAILDLEKIVKEMGKPYQQFSVRNSNENV